MLAGKIHSAHSITINRTKKNESKMCNSGKEKNLLKVSTILIDPSNMEGLCVSYCNSLQVDYEDEQGGMTYRMILIQEVTGRIPEFFLNVNKTGRDLKTISASVKNRVYANPMTNSFLWKP